MFFENWFAILRILIVGVLAYASLIVILRISGKRTLSKWNAFDFIVTIALGSTLATVITSKDVVFIEGFLGLSLLVALQFLITWLAVRLKAVRAAVGGDPTLLLYRGRILNDALIGQRVTASEVRAAVRSSGVGSLNDIEAVVLETDGNFSVIKMSDRGSGSALLDVEGYKGVENGQGYSAADSG